MEFKLIIKKLQNNLSHKEEKIFTKWYSEKKEHQRYFDKVLKKYNTTFTDIDVEKAWMVLRTKLKQKKQRQKWWKYAVALIVVSIASIPYVYKNNIKSKEQKQVKTIQRVKPGTNKATLTLENGSQVILSENKKLTSPNSNVDGKKIIYKKKTINKKEAVKYNYLTVPRGGQFFATLSDGTKVWLNSDSKLKYPVAFVKNQDRSVELIYGEAYFEVSPSSKHNGVKFNVKTQQQLITVLGTQFNVQAYKDENTIITTLVEGRINMDYGVKNQELHPSQQAIFNVKDEKFTVKNVEVYDYIAWQRGIFSFRNKSLEEIAKVLSRWYDIDIVIENKELQTTTFNGILSKDQKLKTILEIINKTNPISYFIEKDKMVFK